MVDVQAVATHAAQRPFAYLITITAHGRIHTSVTHPVAADGVIRIPAASTRARTNASAHTDVSLVWPPEGASGYSLIVDGTARGGDDLVIDPTRAILHRPAEEPGEGPGCVQDCIEL